MPREQLLTSLACLSLFSCVSLCIHSGSSQAGHQAASTAVDSDSDNAEDFDQYSDLDAFDTDEVEVSPDDEQALAAFMVSLSAASSPQDCHAGRAALLCYDVHAIIARQPLKHNEGVFTPCQ